MKFNKNVPWENREVLAAQLKRYEKEVDMKLPQDMKEYFHHRFA